MTIMSCHSCGRDTDRGRCDRCISKDLGFNLKVDPTLENNAFLVQAGDEKIKVTNVDYDNGFIAPPDAIVKNFNTDVDLENSVMNVTYDIDQTVAKNMMKNIDEELIAQMTKEQLIQNPHVLKLVEALEYIVKPHVGMSGISVNKNGSACVERAKEALAEWEGE